MRKWCKLAIQSIVGLTPKRALKLWGTFLKSAVTILITSGIVKQTHNFNYFSAIGQRSQHTSRVHSYLLGEGADEGLEI